MRLIRRRSLLRGLAMGAAAPLIGPFLDGVLRQAWGQPAAKRLLFIGGWMSFGAKVFRPTVRTPTDFDLSPAMAALKPYVADLNLITDLYCHGYYQNGGHGMMPADFLSGKRSAGWENPASPTFDRFLASKIGMADRFSSLHMNLGDRLADGITSPYVSPLQSWDGPSRPYPAMQNVVEAYDKIFAQAVPSVPDGVDTKALLARDRSLLDFVRKDIARTRARLAAPEGEKLDVYTESLRAIERKLVPEAAPAACRTPARPAGATMPALTRAEIFVDTAAAALACGASRIANVFFNTGDYTAAGVPGPNIHDTVFHQSGLPELEVQKWRMAQVARAVAHTRELGHKDTTLVVCADPNGNEHHGGGESLFFITIGRLGGALKAGQVLAHPRKTRAVNDVWTSLANAFGVPIDRYGDAEHARGPLPGLT